MKGALAGVMGVIALVLIALSAAPTGPILLAPAASGARHAAPPAR